MQPYSIFSDWLAITAIIFWLGFAGLVAGLAARNGRDALIAFLLAVLCSPVLAGLGYLIAGPTEDERRSRVFEDERLRADARRSMEGHQDRSRAIHARKAVLNSVGD